MLELPATFKRREQLALVPHVTAEDHSGALCSRQRSFIYHLCERFVGFEKEGFNADLSIVVASWQCDNQATTHA